MRTNVWKRVRALLAMFVLGAFLAGCESTAPVGNEGDSTTSTATAGNEASGEQATNTDDDTAAAPVTNDPPQLLSDEELAAGWISLFDGQTDFGWQTHSDAKWEFKNGMIAVEEGEAGLLCTTTQFADYILKLEFRSAAGTNSGIFLHTPLVPEDPANDCYELNIAPPDNAFPTGSLVKRAKAEGDFESDDWQAYEVTVNRGLVNVKLDGRSILDYEDPQPLRRGPIGLQLNQGKVEFRNIKLRPVGVTDLFNGKDLTGWKDYPDMLSKFTVTEEGWLNVQNGSGQLETEGSYGDFLFQLECISNAPQLNSGIFFRCIPGDPMNGYESQIHNGFKDGDRASPVDCGTGGIFRRQSARRVVADDGQWFHKTIIADGPHIAVWVNGYQVSDWTDDRTPHENPRNGQRSEPGTIIIQGHDPTTDLSFRNLRIVELPLRSEPRGE